MDDLTPPTDDDHLDAERPAATTDESGGGGRTPAERRAKLQHARAYVRAMLLDGQSRESAVQAIERSDLDDRDPRAVVEEVHAELVADADRAQAPASVVPLGLAAGLVGAVVGAGIWAEIVDQTHYQVGIVAIAIGFAVSWCALRATGGRTNRQLAVGVALLTLVGFVLGKYLTLWLAIRHDVPGTSPVDSGVLRYFWNNLGDVFDAFDIVFALIAVSVGWRAMQPQHGHPGGRGPVRRR